MDAEVLIANLTESKIQQSDVTLTSGQPYRKDASMGEMISCYETPEQDENFAKTNTICSNFWPKICHRKNFSTPKEREKLAMLVFPFPRITPLPENKVQ